MQIKNLFVLACLLAASFLRADTPPLNEPNNFPLTSEGESCNLPEPTNFQIIDNGPLWVNLGWDLTNPFHQHRINVYSCKDGSLVKTFVTEAGVTNKLIFFDDPGKYKFEIKAICFSGDSPNSSWIDCTDIKGDGIILELVYQAFPPTQSTARCIIYSPNGGDKCYFSSTGVATFRVRNEAEQYITKEFTMEHVSIGTNHLFKLKVRVPNPPPLGQPPSGEFAYSFFVDDQPPQNDPPAHGLLYKIKYQNFDIAEFVADYDSETQRSFLMGFWVLPGWDIVRTSDFDYPPPPPPKPEQQLPSFTSERDEGSPIAPFATASPNPFTDLLDIYPANPTAESIQLQLYNLAGQKVLDQQFPGGQEQYSLSTASLSPGFYMLRIEADGNVQTLKVIKSE